MIIYDMTSSKIKNGKGENERWKKKLPLDFCKIFKNSRQIVYQYGKEVRVKI
jgi:hypothetical protein